MKNRNVKTIPDKMKEPGVHCLGDCLYLIVGKLTKTEDGKDGPPVSASWVARVNVKGMGRKDMGLGSTSAFTLAQASAMARDARALALQGIDPIAAREAELKKKRDEQAKAITFKKAIEEFIELRTAGDNPAWKPRRPRKRGGDAESEGTQLRRWLERYVYEKLGHLPVADVEREHIKSVLLPIWFKINDTAARIRRHLFNFFDWAMAERYRPEGVNPADMRFLKQSLLPQDDDEDEHHPALPWEKMPAFWQHLNRMPGMSPRALEFLILTAARTGQVMYAEWSQINLAEKLWICPDDIMKMKRLHVVPLSPPALAILEEMDRFKGDSPLIFPGGKMGCGDTEWMSNVSMYRVLKRMIKRGWDYRDEDGRAITVHGMRSTFADWADNRNFGDVVSEDALAHKLTDGELSQAALAQKITEMVFALTGGANRATDKALGNVDPNTVRRAYKRSPLLIRREALMDAWGRYCLGGEAKILSIQARPMADAVA